MTGLATWLAVGLIAGGAAKLLLPGPRMGWPLGLGLGMVGGLTGGALSSWMAMGGAAELDPRSATSALLLGALLPITAQLARTLRRPPASRSRNRLEEKDDDR